MAKKDIIRKIRLVMWKNYMLRKRRKVLTFFEIFLPFMVYFAYMGVSYYNAFEKGDIIKMPSYPTSYPVSTPSQTVQRMSSIRNLYYNNISPFYEELVKSIAEKLKTYGKSIKTKPFKDKKQLLKYYDRHVIELILSKNYKPNDLAKDIAVIFKDQSKSGTPKNLKYTIYYSGNHFKTDRMFFKEEEEPQGPGNADEMYIGSNFVILQLLIDDFFINKTLKNDPVKLESYNNSKISAQRFPYPAYQDRSDLSKFIQAWSGNIYGVFVLGFMITWISLLIYIIVEKRTGVKELMKLMGIESWILWVGWILHCLILNVVTITILVILIKCLPATKSKTTTYTILPLCDGVILWLFNFFYIFSTMCFCFFLSSLVNRPFVAVLIFLFGKTVLSTFVQQFKKISDGAIFVTKLLDPTVCWEGGYQTIVLFEYKGNKGTKATGMTWSNLAEKPSLEATPLIYYFLIFLFQIVLYSLLTWYFDNVKPGHYGLAKHWYFPCTKLLRKSPKFDNSEINVDLNLRNIEEPSSPLETGIVIKNVRKIYGRIAAVDGLSMDIYKDKITALLGQNGAGKTTIMSILTGMFSPTSGDVFINNYNIKTEMDKIRHTFGLCPQHDMLFTYLTVRDHFILFSKIKGKTTADAKKDAEHWIARLNIKDKGNNLVQYLSGGMKRKLSLGIALIGDPKVVMLDEPTSGLDPEERRKIWNIVLGLRGPEKVIMITTHSMDEADVLGDRIAIMDHGKLICYGTSMFLKHIYGTGYHLSLLKSNEYTNVNDITDIINRHVPSGRLKDDTAGLVTFLLPSDTSNEFPGLFHSLEMLKSELHISGIGLSVTTMEEVFLRVGQIIKEELTTVPQKQIQSENVDGSIERSCLKEKGLKLELYRLKALLRKKLVYMKKKYFFYIVVSLVPVIIAILAIQMELKNYSKKLPLTLSLKHFSKPMVFYNTKLNNISKVYSNLLPANCIKKPVNNVHKEVLKLAENDLTEFRKRLIVGAVFNEIKKTKANVSSSYTELIAMYSNIALHAFPISLNLISNTLLKYLSGNDYSIKTTNFPLEVFSSEYVFSLFFLGLMLSLGFVVFVSCLIGFPLDERTSKFKHLQLMTGLRPFTYWCSMFIVDFCYYIFAVLLVLFVIGVFYTRLNGNELTVLFVFISFYGFCGILYCYLLTLFFKKTQSAVIFSLVSYFGFILLVDIVIAFFRLLEKGKNKSDPDDMPSIKFLKSLIFIVSPHVMLNEGIFRVTDYAVQRQLVCKTYKYICESIKKGEINEEKKKDYKLCCMSLWKYENLPFIISVLDIFIYFILLMAIENRIILIQIFKYFKRAKKSQQQNTSHNIEQYGDPDVIKESKYVSNYLKSDNYVDKPKDNLLVHQLEKKFHKVKAVNRISFSVRDGECFGLLGVNGAGKTTAFRLLTGDIKGTGDALIDNVTLNKNRRAFLSRMGYCPQFEGILPVLSGREILKLFAKLRGVPQKEIKDEVNKWLTLLGLTEFADQACGTYSGGNKRKLSAALALIGDPQIILLDEPTTGVDPVSRRNLWNVLSNVNQQSIVLTTHSMEECEALCDRIAIMVKGEFKCFGSIQYLKQRFGQGFTIKLKLKSIAKIEEVVDLKRNVEQDFDCVLIDEHKGFLHYQVTNPQTSWYHLFNTIERLKSTGDSIIEDYTITETTLEQIFLSFARQK